jgi:hypothetical protein
MPDPEPLPITQALGCSSNYSPLPVVHGAVQAALLDFYSGRGCGFVLPERLVDCAHCVINFG